MGGDVLLRAQARIEILEEVRAKARRHVVRLALAKVVDGQCGAPCVEIAVVGRQHARGLGVDELCVVGQLVGLARELRAVFHAGHQHVDLLVPDAQRVGQRAGEAAQEAQVVLVHPAGAERRHQRAAVFHKFLNALRKVAAQHVGEGQHQHVVAGEVAGLVDDVHGNAQAPQRGVVIHHGVQILFVHIIEALRVLQRPAVLPVVDQRDAGGRGGAHDGVHRLELRTHLRDLAEHAGVLVAAVIHHRAVQLLGGAAALAELEVLHRVRAVRHGLHGLQQVHAGAVQAGIGPPVGGGGAALHQQEGLAVLEAARQVVLKGEELRDAHVVHGVLPLGIAVPAGKVHVLGQAVVVDALVGAHQVGGAGDVGRDALEGLGLDVVPLDELLGGKALPVELEAVDGLLADGRGRLDLAPVGVGVAPEGGPPRGVERVKRAVLFLQPQAEVLLAGRAVALAGQLVGDVPGAQRGVILVALGQQRVDLLHLVAVDFAGEAVVVAPAVQLLFAALVDAQHLGVLLAHPRGASGRGRGQDRGDAVCGHLVHDLVQPGEVVDALLGLQRLPGEYAHRQRVDARELGHAHVFVPDDVLIGEPLVGVVVAAMDHVRNLGDERGIFFHKERTAFLKVSVFII